MKLKYFSNIFKNICGSHISNILTLKYISPNAPPTQYTNSLHKKRFCNSCSAHNFGFVSGMHTLYLLHYKSRRTLFADEDYFKIPFPPAASSPTLSLYKKDFVFLGHCITLASFEWNACTLSFTL